jgi:3-phosphoshikimate 1-carboxyvinyltransferase
MTARRAAKGLAGSVRVPGDKSISHRALMFGALAVGETRITGLLEGEDVLRTAAAMRALGATVTQDSPGTWRVSGRGIGGLTEPQDVLDMGNAGTAARLISGILAGHGIFSVLTGDGSLRRRPMRRVIEPLSASGAVFSARAGGRLPMAIQGAREPLPLDYTLPVASAQVKSAVLLCGLCAAGQTRVVEPEPTRDHTETMLRHFGATVLVADTPSGREILLTGQPELVAADVAVPADPSSAAFPLVAAAVVPGSAVVLRAVGLNPLRNGLLTTLREMGASLTIENARTEGGEPVGDLHVAHAALKGVVVPAERAPSMIDEFPVLSVAAAMASGTTRMQGLAELRVKESDRLAAVAAMLQANGVRFAIEGDDLIVHGSGGAPMPGGGLVATHMDHRIAMSALVLGQVASNQVRIDDGGFIDTSFPGFAALMRGLGAEIVAHE